jgi:hypothetical protein
MRSIVIVLVTLLSLNAFADDTDANFGQIKKIDLGDEAPQEPNHILLMMKLYKVNPGVLAQVTLYQFSKRSRIDFDGGGLPRTEYSLSVASSCSASKWTELHHFKPTEAHVQTEKSLPDWSLRIPVNGKRVLLGKSLALFRVKPHLMIDCQIIK